MRKIISLVLCFALLLTLALPAMAATVKQEIKDGVTEVTAGAQVQIDVTLDEDVKGIATFEYRLFYDPDIFEFVSKTGTVDVTNNTSKPETPYIAITKCWDGENTFDIAAGTIASVVFKAKADIADAQDAGFELKIEAVDDPDFNSLVNEFTTENSKLEITVKPEAVVVPTYTVTLPQGEGYTITPVQGSESPVEEGGSFSFTVNIQDGYEEDDMLLVEANGEGVAEKNGVYTISNITADQVVTVEGVVKKEQEAKTYTVTLPTGEGYTAAPANGSTSPVAEGGSYSFSVTVKDGYEGDPVVQANGLTLALRDGVYTISNITADQTVTITGIQKAGQAADVVVYQNGSYGAQWPTTAPVYVNTLTLKGLSVKSFAWDEAYENCTVTLHESTADNAAYSLAAVVAVQGHEQMLSMFSATINDQDYTGRTFTYSGSLENGEAEIVVTAKAGNYTGTKSFHLVADGGSVEPEPQPETYDVTLTQGEGYTITAAEGSESPVTEGGSFSFTVSVNDGYQGTPVVAVNGETITAVNGVYTIENIAEDKTVTVSGISRAAEGYSVSVPAKASGELNGEVTVTVTVSHSDETVAHYNAYDVTLSYDPAVLTFVSGTAAHSGAEIKNKSEAGTIQIVGYGEDKAMDVALATLKFTAIESGVHEVSIETAKVDNSGNAIKADTPNAAVPNEDVVVTVPYTVTLPDGFTGEPTVLPGADYSFTAPSAYYDVTVTVGGEVVTPEVEGLTYTIRAVDGDVVVTAEGKTYNVIKNAENATISGADTAQHGTDYSFTVAAESGYMISNVSVKIGEEDVGYSVDASGKYVVSGADIKGDMTITVTTVSAEGHTQITFTGVDSDEVVGGLIQTAENGKDFTFRLNKEEGYTYVVKLNGERLTPNAEGVYTIPGSMINGTALTVVITKTAMGTMTVAVKQYLTLDETVMWLVTANMDEQVLAYGEKGTMFWSDKYDAYCWLVISADSEENVLAAAQEAIVADETATAAEVAYDGDVNQTQEVDVNDAQVTYNMYQSKMYTEEFDVETMAKFLEADVNGDSLVDVNDAAAIVAMLLK